MKDDLGDRMKLYESAEAGRRLMPLLPVLARIDGRAFHSFTRGMARPFDADFSACMVDTTAALVRDTGARKTMRIEQNSPAVAGQVERLIMWWKRRRCEHLFRGPDMKPRDAAGMVEWPCSKCGKIFREPYGLLMLMYGKITGPWG